LPARHPAEPSGDAGGIQDPQGPLRSEASRQVGFFFACENRLKGARLVFDKSKRACPPTGGVFLFLEKYVL